MSRIHAALQELVSAQSSLNMPEPASCPPTFVVHAYEHISAAIRILAEEANPDLAVRLTSVQITPEGLDAWQTEWCRLDDLNRLDIGLHALIRGLGYEVPDSALDATAEAVSARIREPLMQFVGVPCTPYQLSGIKSVIVEALRQLEHEGYFPERWRIKRPPA
jgi:hypothetical protein